ncbi:hypothetical protein K461DRAFT_274870 [Myriangium duriaei CBS 260.36]|uniref:Uncharacterized protein n=1 Tax=Myriangium duriaei CBS 260.36 TaxID=1168546 RepID=A0A9P4J687_9PEZI|nr:hypothetical protein K461DRAFT_274870 [Myriangium duriaei CBS 260.36]
MSSVPSNTPAPADAAAVAAAKAAVANPSTQPQGQGDAPFPDASVTSPTSVGPTTTTTSLPSDAPKAPTVDHAKLPATDSTKALTSDAFKAPAADGTSTQPAIMPVPADSVKITISDKAPIKDGPDVFHAPDAHSTSIIITPGRPGTSPSETQAPFTPQVPSSNQGPPTSIPLPPPQPSTVSVIQAPLTPDHITIPPKFPPVLGAAGTPSTPVTGNQSHPDDVHKQPERIDTLIDLPGHTPRSRRNSADGGKVKPSNLPLPTRPGYNRAASSSDLRSGLASPIIPPGAVE